MNVTSAFTAKIFFMLNFNQFFIVQVPVIIDHMGFAAESNEQLKTISNNFLLPEIKVN